VTGLPALVGVIHLAPLPSSPRWGGSMRDVVEAAVRDALALAKAGFDAIVVENFGDAPFSAGEVDPATVAAMTRCALVVREATPGLALGINVLRNDARAALGIAAACGASFVRINVHVGARLTDQGLVTGAAHDTLRRRRALGLDEVKLFCDVAVKHSAPLAPRPIEEEAAEAVERGLADAVLVTGAATGAAAAASDVRAVLQAVKAPVYVASGVTAADAGALRALGVHGVVVGSALRASGRAGDPVDPELAAAFAQAFRA
jgi:membrane complex biogenesis BtpA family protein